MRVTRVHLDDGDTRPGFKDYGSLRRRWIAPYAGRHARIEAIRTTARDNRMAAEFVEGASGAGARSGKSTSRQEPEVSVPGESRAGHAHHPDSTESSSRTLPKEEPLRALTLPAPGVGRGNADGKTNGSAAR